MQTILFLLTLTGFIKVQDIHEDRLLYTFLYKGVIYEHAYEQEIVNAIKTGEFIYDETLR